MLPSLSTIASAKVQVVGPATVDPAAVSARRHALIKLKNVVAVRVLDHKGHGDDIRYSVEVALDAQNGVALFSAGDSRGSVTSISTDEGDTPRPGENSHKHVFRTEKALDDFIDLHNQVYYAAHAAHRREPCQFCAKVVQYAIVAGPKPDSMTLRLLGEERAKRKLTQFVAGLLELVVRLSTTEARVCAGRVRIPALVYEFLLPATSDAGEAA